MTENPNSEQQFVVLINDEEQYSLWPQGKAVPAGWRAAGKEGSKSECCDYVDSVWTDMRPLSLRRKMEELGYRDPAR
jgi:MbtH protein